MSAPARGDQGDGRQGHILTDVTEKRVLEAHAIRNARSASLGVWWPAWPMRSTTPTTPSTSTPPSWRAVGGTSARSGPPSPGIRRLQPRRHARGQGPGRPAATSGGTSSTASRRIEKIVGNLKHMARPDAGDLDHAVGSGRYLLDRPLPAPKPDP